MYLYVLLICSSVPFMKYILSSIFLNKTLSSFSLILIISFNIGYVFLSCLNLILIESKYSYFTFNFEIKVLRVAILVDSYLLS